MSGRTQPEMFSPTPSTLSLKTMLAASSHDRINDTESNHITVSIDVHTASLHADVDQDLFADPPAADEWYDAGLKEDEVSKLNDALYGYRKARKLWHQHLVSVLESLNYHPLLTDPSCFRNDETNKNIFVHVDDRLMFGPKNEVLNLVELLSKQVLLRITGRMEKAGDKIYFLGRVIERTARGYSVEANPKYIQNVINSLGLEEAKPVMTPSEEDANDRKNHSLRWKPKDKQCTEQLCEILERRSECKEPDRNHYTFKVRERVHRQRLDRTSNNVQEHKWRSCAVEKCNTHSMATNTANSKFQFC